MTDAVPAARTDKPARATPSRRAATASKATASKTAAAKAAARRPRAAKAKAATTAGATRRTRTAGAPPRNATARVGDYAERAVLIPVGAALIAREQVVSGVSDALSAYSTPAKAQAQLRKFERRGGTARSRLEREVRKTRTRAERELRERRHDLERRRERLTKGLSDQVEQAQTQLERTQAHIEGVVRARFEDGTDLASRLQERVLRSA